MATFNITIKRLAADGTTWDILNPKTTIENVTGLQAALNGKAASVHNHDASNITSGIISNSRLPSTFVNLTDGQSNLPYKGSIIVYGDSNKYYPVHFGAGNQDLLRTIKIWRVYYEQAPSDWYTSTHKGSLNLEWKGNYGGWGGAVYNQWIYENTSAYTTLLAETQLVDNSYAMAFFLRGGGSGGAIYHIASDQPLSWPGHPYLTYDKPTVFYNQDLTFNNPDHARYAPAPRTTVNTSQLDSITVVKGGDSRLTNARPASDVHAWAKAENRPSYNLDQISEGSTYKRVTQSDKDTWNAKFNTPSGSSAQYVRGNGTLAAFPTSLPASDVHAWAKAENRPTYNLDQISEGATYTRVTHSDRNIWNNKQNSLGYTPENLANRRGNIRTTGADNTSYVTELGIKTYVDEKTSLKSNTDDRSVATIPNDYNHKLDIKGLKTNSVIGITGGGTYSALMGIRGWSDSSGGNSHELAFDGDGAIYHRHGATTSWNAWTKLVEDNDPRLTNARPADDVHPWAKSSQALAENRFLRVYNNVAYWRTQAEMRSDLGLGTLATWSSIALNDITGVTYDGTPVNGQILLYGSGTWYNATLGIANISGLQTQLDGKQSTIGGAATTITASNLTANRALISNGSGKVAVSAVTTTELGYLDGVTSNIQTQLNSVSILSSATKTLALSDAGKMIIPSANAARTFTIPLDSSVNFPIGTRIQFYRRYAADVTITRASVTITINGGESVSISDQYKMIEIFKLAANTWVAIGAVS